MLNRFAGQKVVLLCIKSTSLYWHNCLMKTIIGWRLLYLRPFSLNSVCRTFWNRQQGSIIEHRCDAEIGKRCALHLSDSSNHSDSDIWEISFLFVPIAETREHGVGFYEFAKDEETRQKQLEALKKLRQQV